MQSPCTDSHKKTAIVVVHGVGHPQKGDTLREVSQGLVSYLNRTGQDLPVEFHDSHLMVGTPTENARNNVYEAPVRRFQLSNTDYVATEVFWGDLSQIKPGVISMLRGLFDLLYGLPAIIRHMIEEAGDSFEAASIAKYGMYIRLAISAILGPVLAMSFLSVVVIFLSAVIYKLKPVLTSCDVDACLRFDAGIMLLGILALIGVTWRMRQWFKQRQWSTMTLIYLFYFSIIAAIWMVAALLAEPISPYTLLESIPRLLIVMWIVSAFCNGLAIFYLLRVKALSTESVNNGVTASFNLTELSYTLWGILTAGLFFLTFKLLPAEYFNVYLGTVCAECDVFDFCTDCPVRGAISHSDLNPISWIAVPFLGLLLTVCVFLCARFAPQHASNNTPRRLIFPDALFKWMLWFTVIVVVLFCMYGVSLALNLELESWLFGWINYASQVVVWLLAVVIFLFTVFARQILNGLDIGLDIANYWREDRDIADTAEVPVGVAKVFRESKTGHTRSWVSKLIDIDHVLSDFRVFTANTAASQSAGDSASEESFGNASEQPARFGTDIKPYFKRYEMRTRFIATLEAVLAEKPDKLVVLSHSQGTMVAIDGLRHMQLNQASQSDSQSDSQADAQPEQGRQVFDDATGQMTHLVTMGSPYQHLYQHYFPRTHQPDPFVGERPVKSWLNIFRTNDYIGQEISGPDKHIRNEHVGARGHTGYWRDEDVLRYIVTHLEEQGVSLR